MKIVKIEPTPSPNTMKVVLDEILLNQQRFNYRVENKETAPKEIQALFSIEGVKMIYHVADFLAVERNPKVDWISILEKVKEVLGAEGISKIQSKQVPLGEKRIFVQYFLHIPMQVKVEGDGEEQRFGLDVRFKEVIFKLQNYANNVVMERKWVDEGSRFGTMEEVGQEVVEEIEAAYPQSRLNELLAPYVGETVVQQERQVYQDVSLSMFEVEDWKVRYELLHRLNPTEKDVPLLQKALQDEKMAIRRLATAYLGLVGGEHVLPLLYEGLKDNSVAIRRTAGDVISDLGFVEATPVMIEALEDENKLVRWRAAMFLYESGDERAIPALEKAKDDEAFEVSLQAQMALERIKGGEEAKGAIWKQMLESRKKN